MIKGNVDHWKVALHSFVKLNDETYSSFARYATS